MKNKRPKLYALIPLIIALSLLAVYTLTSSERRDLEKDSSEGVAKNQVSSESQADRSIKEQSGLVTSNVNSSNQGSPRPAPSSFAQVQSPALLRMLNDAILVESREEQNQSSGQLKRSLLFQTAFKYPLIKVEQIVEQGTGVILDETAAVADHVIVQVDRSLTEAEVQRIAANHGYQIRKKMFTANSYLIEDSDPGLDSLDHLLQVLDPSQQNGVVIAEADFIVHATAVPNDPDFTELWGLNNTGQTGGVVDADIDAPEAWEITTGSKDVVVAVIDTGIDYNHVDLAANMWRNPGEIPDNGIDDDNNGFIDDVYGWDFANDDADPLDDQRHGTHCAGTIGAVGNNGTGVVGVCWNISLMAIKFLGGSGSGTSSDAADSISYSTMMNVDLTSNSWGGGGESEFLRNAIQEAQENDILFVAAAGNSAVNNDVQPHYPAAYDLENIISVASTDANDHLSSFSNYGPNSVDLGAPGSRILSTVPGNNSYNNLSGTSMAAPHVAGVCALIKVLASEMSYEEVKNQVLQHVDPIPELDGITVSGGRLNAYGAVLPIGRSFIEVVEIVIDDDDLGETKGNGDGIINPGELIGLNLTLRNIGSEDAMDLVSSLSLNSSASFFTITDDLVNVGDLGSVSQITASAQFLVEVSSNAPTPGFGSFTITTQDGSTPPEAWEYTFDLGIYVNSSISGKVLDKEGSVPVANALVEYAGPVSGSVTTQDDGSYTLDVLSGTYTLRVSAQGFFDSTPREVIVPPDQNDFDFVLLKPDLRISPTSVVSVLNLGDQESQTITLDNRGTGALAWTASIQSPNFAESFLPSRVVSTPSDPENPNSLMINHHVPELIYPLANLTGKKVMIIGNISSYSIIESDLLSRGAIVIEKEFPLYSQDLLGVWALVIDNRIFNADYYSDVEVIREWVSDGGGLFMIADSRFTANKANAVLADTGLRKYATALRSGLFDNILPHPIMEGVSSIYSYGYTAYYQVSSPAQTIVFDDQDRTHAAVSTLGSGKILAVANEILADQNFFRSDTRLFANQAIDWLAGESEWIELSSLSGTIQEGNTQEVILNLDASRLSPGVLNAEIVFSWDDPEGKTATLPVTLTTVGSTQISAKPTSVGFGDVVVGASQSALITVTNDGTNPLNVGEFLLDRSEFTINFSTNFKLEPGESEDIVVTFAPQSFEDIYGTLTIQSDADNNTNLTIPLSGQGITGPVDHFDWDIIASPQLVNEPFSVSITARDIFENVVTGFNSSINLNAYTGAVVSDSLIIDTLSSDGGLNTSSDTFGYSFTPNEDLVVTHVRHFVGEKISIWEENGTLISSTPVTSIKQTWLETPLSSKVLLRSGETYRVAYLNTIDSSQPLTDSFPSTFPHGVINSSYNAIGDVFPTNDSGTIGWFVDLRYEVLTGTPVTMTPASSTSFTSGSWTGDLNILEAASSLQIRAQDPSSGSSGFSAFFDVEESSGVNLAPMVAFNSSSELVKSAGYEGIYIEADASDSDGSIDSVKLFLDGVLVRTDRKSPYNWFGARDPVLVGLDPGIYELKLLAKDNEGATAEAVATLTVNGPGDNMPPVVTFSKKSTLTLDQGYTSIQIEAKASDSDGSIASVELYLDGTLVGLQDTPRYKWNENRYADALLGLGPGAYQLTLIATDNEGISVQAMATLTVVGVGGNLPPAVAFHKKSTLSLEEGYSKILIRAEASDPDGSVAYVQLYFNGDFIGENDKPRYRWNEKKRPELLGLDQGTYTLTLVAVDDLGSMSQATATLTIEPSGPTLVLSDDFEGKDGFGDNWVSGGEDCFLDDSGLYVNGTTVVNLQDNSESSVLSSRDLALSGYLELRVEFDYQVKSFEEAEDFWLQISTDGGVTYETIFEFVNEVDFQDDGTVYMESLVITGYLLTEQTRLRFRCDASGNNDDLFIDNIGIWAE